MLIRGRSKHDSCVFIIMKAKNLGNIYVYMFAVKLDIMMDNVLYISSLAEVVTFDAGGETVIAPSMPVDQTLCWRNPSHTEPSNPFCQCRDCTQLYFYLPLQSCRTSPKIKRHSAVSMAPTDPPEEDSPESLATLFQTD